MIEKIIIHNFQNHRSFEQDLNLLNAIVGESDKGKSAILRALRWVLTNEAPKNPITFGEDECSVEIIVDGHSLIRKRTKKENTYNLDGTEYSALRGEVPEQIQKILGISENEIQGQFDNVFWFSLSGGEVAKKVNDIVDLDIIDFFFSELKSKIRDESTRQKIVEEQKSKTEAEIEKLNGIDSLSKRADQIEKLQDKIQKEGISRKIDSLSSLISRIEELQNLDEKAQQFKESENNWTELYLKYKETAEKTSLLKEILDTVHRYTPRQEMPDTGDLTAEIEKLYKSQSMTKKRLQEISDLIASLVSSKNRLETIKAECQQLQHEFESKFEGICPYCGAKL